MSFNTPVLFTVFRRPNTTAKVFEAIRKVRPKKLYIAADGPKLGDSRTAELIDAVKAIVLQVDWDCEVQTKFSDVNLGCKKAISSAISWFFEHEEEGIILEDDCLPHENTFYYWAQLLDYYRNDKTVGHIGSVCFLRSQQPTDESYFFSKYAHVWGWATWRRAWLLYDANLENLPQAEEKGVLRSFHRSDEELRFWREKLWKCKLGAIDTWDYQWNYSLWWHGLKSITPFQNHTENIGFDPEGATHTTQKELPWYAELKAIEPPKSLHHPQDIFYREDLDKETFVNMHLESSHLLNLLKDLKRRFYLISVTRHFSKE